MMGFPAIPFKLCDFWSIEREAWNDGTLTVYGTLPGGDGAVATFKRQSVPKGSWCAATLESRK
jgi:hypothetical protein